MTPSQWIEARLPARWQWLDDYALVGNELWRLIALVLIVAAAWVVGRIIRAMLEAASRRACGRMRRLAGVTLAALARPTALAVVVLGLHLGLQMLLLNSVAHSISQTLVMVLGTAVVGYAAFSLVSVMDEWLRAISGQTASKLDDMLVPLVRSSLHAAIIVLVIAQIATFIGGTQVTSIIAGLGVGALAVGLAAQDTIKNFFGSMMIFGDRPFELGDQIIVDSHEGVVEVVGFRSTRFRTGEGHLVTIPNGELANKTIVNVSRRQKLQRKLSISLPATVPVAKLEQALEQIRGLLAHHEGMLADMPPRVFVNDITPGAITLQVTYWYSPPDWWKFMALNEQINLQILAALEGLGIAVGAGGQAIRVQTEAVPAPQAKAPEGKPPDSRP